VGYAHAIKIQSIRSTLEPEARQQAKERQGTRTDLPQHRGKLPPSSTGENPGQGGAVLWSLRTDARAALAFATSRERQRSGDITSGLTNGDRYVIRFTAPSSVNLRNHAAAVIAQVSV